MDTEIKIFAPILLSLASTFVLQWFLVLALRQKLPSSGIISSVISSVFVTTLSTIIHAILTVILFAVLNGTDDITLIYGINLMLLPMFVFSSIIVIPFLLISNFIFIQITKK